MNPGKAIVLLFRLPMKIQKDSTNTNCEPIKSYMENNLHPSIGTIEEEIQVLLSVGKFFKSSHYNNMNHLQKQESQGERRILLLKAQNHIHLYFTFIQTSST